MLFSKGAFSLLITFATMLLNGCPKQATTTDNPTPMESGQEITEKNEERSDKWLAQQATFEEKRKMGVDFYAFGPDSAWEVSIDADRSFVLKVGAQVVYNSDRPTDGMRPADLNANVYTSSSDGAVVTLSAYPDTCKDASSSEGFPYQVRITRRDTDGEISSYSGCGLYLNDPALNDIYVLKSWSAAGDLRQEFEAGAPRLEFHFNDNTVLGYDGRCEIFGKFEPMGDRMRIYQLDFQVQDCRSDDRTAFFDHVNTKEQRIILKNGELTMTNNRDVLVFQKVD